MEGSFELPVQGQATRTLKAGDGFQIPPETPHAGGKPGDKKTRIAITYVVEKGKPLVSPAEARIAKDFDAACGSRGPAPTATIEGGI